MHRPAGGHALCAAFDRVSSRSCSHSSILDLFFFFWFFFFRYEEAEHKASDTTRNRSALFCLILHHHDVSVPCRAQAAVAILLFESSVPLPTSSYATSKSAFADGPPQFHVLMTTRALHLRSHPGQASLPGGKVDWDDKGVEQTALRESAEEVGLPEHLGDEVVWIHTMPPCKCAWYRARQPNARGTLTRSQDQSPRRSRIHMLLTLPLSPFNPRHQQDLSPRNTCHLPAAKPHADHSPSNPFSFRSVCHLVSPTPHSTFLHRSIFHPSRRPIADRQTPTTSTCVANIQRRTLARRDALPSPPFPRKPSTDQRSDGRRPYRRRSADVRTCTGVQGPRAGSTALGPTGHLCCWTRKRWLERREAVGRWRKWGRGLHRDGLPHYRGDR